MRDTLLLAPITVRIAFGQQIDTEAGGPTRGASS